VCGVGLLAATAMFGCAHHDRIVRREIVQVVPSPVVERRETIVEAAPLPPLYDEYVPMTSTRVEQHRTIIEEY
jgi:hypothetical protein